MKALKRKPRGAAKLFSLVMMLTLSLLAAGSALAGPPGGADVGITKTIDNTSPSPGDIVTYTLTASDNGPGEAVDTKITDQLPAGVTYLSDDGGCSLSGTTLTCPVGGLGVGQTHVVHVKATVNPPLPTSSPTSIDVQKVEDSFSLQGGQTETFTAGCPDGYRATDGSAQVDAVDQGTGTLGSVVASMVWPDDFGTYSMDLTNNATGQAQGHLTVVCLKTTTSDGNPLTVLPQDVAGADYPAGVDTKTLTCPTGYTAIAPGYQFGGGVPAVLRSQTQSDDGSSITWVFDAPTSLPAQFFVNCLSDSAYAGTPFVFTHASNTVSVPPTNPNNGSGYTQVSATCPTGYEGIVASYSLDPGLLPLGNDPQPITRVFYIDNPTSGNLNATVSLLCLAINTGPAPSTDTVVNVASVVSDINDPNPANDAAQASFTLNTSGGTNNAGHVVSSVAAVQTTANTTRVQVQISCGHASACAGVAHVASGTSVVGTRTYSVAAGRTVRLAIPVEDRFASIVRSAHTLKLTLSAGGKGHRTASKTQLRVRPV